MLPAAQSALESYRGVRARNPGLRGSSFLGWLGPVFSRTSSIVRRPATETDESLSRQLLAKHSLDAEPHLPTALGLRSKFRPRCWPPRETRSAVELLRRSLVTYRNTSIQTRLQKNLDVLGLTGQPTPPLKIVQFLGPKPVALTQLTGSPVLLFFWAHWCGDCKAEGPVIARLSSEFGARGTRFWWPHNSTVTPPREKSHAEG